MEGWIKLHRKILEWEWYDDINTCRLFFHLLFIANHKDRQWRGIDIKRWQKITSLSNLAEETWLSIQNIRTSINKLKSTGELTHKSHSKYSLITIIKYDDYQDTNTPTNKQATSNQQATNNKQEWKEWENEKEEKRAKVIEWLKIYITENDTQTTYLIKTFLELGRKPALNETPEKFKKWFISIMELNWKQPDNNTKKVIDEFKKYWKGLEISWSNISNKDWKSTFSNRISKDR